MYLTYGAGYGIYIATYHHLPPAYLHPPPRPHALAAATKVCAGIRLCKYLLESGGAGGMAVARGPRFAVMRAKYVLSTFLVFIP